MESFWGTLKQEWLNEKHFRTRAEAKAAVFEYIWIFITASVYIPPMIMKRRRNITPPEKTLKKSQRKVVPNP